MYSYELKPLNVLNGSDRLNYTNLNNNVIYQNNSLVSSSMIPKNESSVIPKNESLEIPKNESLSSSSVNHLNDSFMSLTTKPSSGSNNDIEQNDIKPNKSECIICFEDINEDSMYMTECIHHF